MKKIFFYHSMKYVTAMMCYLGAGYFLLKFCSYVWHQPEFMFLFAFVFSFIIYLLLMLPDWTKSVIENKTQAIIQKEAVKNCKLLLSANTPKTNNSDVRKKEKIC